MSGRLEVEAILTDSTTVVLLDETRSGGEHNLSFNAFSLPNGDDQAVKATWHARHDVIAIYRLSFGMLGIYRHTQYNTPSESACGGGHVDRRISADASRCSQVAVRDLKFSFTQQVEINGSGRSTNWGILQSSDVGSCQGFSDFTVVTTIRGSHGRVGNDTVAKRPSHPRLHWDDEVFLMNAPGATVKYVTDSCPGCVDAQLDNYNETNSQCTGSGVGDLGTFLTIRLR